MWDDLNRWWLEHRKPRPQPPEQLTVAMPAEVENETQPPGAERVAEFENSFAETQPADTPQTIKAGESIQEPECVEAGPDPSNSTEETSDHLPISHRSPELTPIHQILSTMSSIPHAQRRGANGGRHRRVDTRNR